MSVPSAAPQTFSWIKSALSESMIDVKDSVSAAMSSESTATLASAAKNLHQIQGSLKMVKLEAASTLAEDLELLTENLENQDFTDIPDKLVVLKHGVELLEKYLIAIERQTPISPLAMVDGMNAARELTGNILLSKLDLFDPPLQFDSVIVSDNVESFSEDKRQGMLFHLRKRFRQALLAWLQGNDGDRALATMLDIISNLQRIGGPDVLQQLWWVAAGFIEAIQNRDIATDSEVKAKFARLDAEMSRMQENRYEEIASSPPDDLLRYMLYFIGSTKSALEEGRVAKGSGEVRMEQIKELLGLQEWFTFELESTLESSFATLIDMVKKMAATVNDDKITSIENQLDKYFSDELNPEETEKFFETLDSLEQSFKNYDSEVMSHFVESMVAATRNAKIQQATLVNTGCDIKVASAFLFFKQTLAAPDSIGENWQEDVEIYTEELRQAAAQAGDVEYDGSALKQQSDREYLTARATVTAELRNQLNEVETIISNIENVDEQKLLVLPEIFKNLANWFHILDEPNVKKLVLDSMEAIEFLHNNGDLARTESCETLAYIIASIGVCLDFIRESNPIPEETFEQAEHHLSLLISRGGSPNANRKKAESSANSARSKGVRRLNKPDQHAEMKQPSDPLMDDALAYIFVDELEKNAEQIRDIAGQLEADITEIKD